MDLMQCRTMPGGNRLWMMREDLLPLYFGGNKVRIGGEYVKDANAKGCDHLIAYGDSHSNLCRVLALMCQAEGMDCTAIFQLGQADTYVDTTNSRMVKAAGARVVTCHSNNVAETVRGLMEEIRAQGQRPYYIHGNEFGKGNEAVPIKAYREAYREIFAEEEQRGKPFNLIFHASGTGTTQSGLLLGQRDAASEYQMRGWTLPQIVGISIGRAADVGADVIWRYMQAGADCEPEWRTRIHLEDQFRKALGGPMLDAAIQEAIQKIFLQECVPADFTYVGRAFLGMERYLTEHGVTGQDVLFIHTGATPLFYYELESM